MQRQSSHAGRGVEGLSHRDENRAGTQWSRHYFPVQDINDASRRISRASPSRFCRSELRSSFLRTAGLSVLGSLRLPWTRHTMTISSNTGLSVNDGYGDRYRHPQLHGRDRLTRRHRWQQLLPHRRKA